MTTTPTPSPTCRDCGGSGHIRNVTIGRPPWANAETVACYCRGTFTMEAAPESRTVDGYHYAAVELTDAAKECRAFDEAAAALAREAKSREDNFVSMTIHMLVSHGFDLDELTTVQQPGHRTCALPKWTGDVLPPDVARLREALSNLDGVAASVADFREAEHQRRSVAQAEALAAAPTTNPYAEERERGVTVADEQARALFRDALHNTRAAIAAQRLTEDGVELVGWSRGDLVAYYVRVLAPESHERMAKGRAARRAADDRRESDHVWGRAQEVEARHDGEIIPEPEPEPEPPIEHSGGRFVTTTDEVTRIIAAGGRVVVGADFGSGDGDAWVTCAVAPDGSITVLDSGTGEPPADEPERAPMTPEQRAVGFAAWKRVATAIPDRPDDSWVTPRSAIDAILAAFNRSTDVASVASTKPQRPRTFTRLAPWMAPWVIDEVRGSGFVEVSRQGAARTARASCPVNMDALADLARQRNAEEAARSPAPSRVPDGMREFLTREMQEFRTDFRDVSDVVAKFDPTISVLGVTWSFPSSGAVAVKIECARGMVDTFDVELSFQPPAPALVRIPDDHLLAAIAGKDGDS